MRSLGSCGGGVRLLVVLVLSLALAGGALAWDSSTRTSPASDRSRGHFAPLAQTKHAVLWAVGDGADEGRTALALSRQIAATRFDRLLYLGDVYEHGSASEFARNYAPSYGRLAEKTWPTPGNHEWPARAQGYDPYWADVIGGRPPAWYSRTVAGWQLLSLNSEAPLEATSPQGRWLIRQLAAPGTCRLAFWHRPRYSAGSHGDQEDIASLWDTLSGHAAIVVNGHDHNMQRLRPIDGITEFISGAGGRSLYELDENDSRLAFANDETYGALRLELRPGSARYTFVELGGRVLDSGTIKCRSDRLPQPAGNGRSSPC
jgi:Calcineurin-like phosphoesterase